MNFDEIQKLVQSISDSPLSEFEYEADGVRLHIKKEKAVAVVAEQAAPVLMATAPAQVTEVNVAMSGGPDKVVKSPLVGTFYVAPSADSEPFVKVGDKVKKGQVLAIVEAMKLMNEIESEYDGTIVEILASNEQSVEYGQPLFTVKGD
ncbi:MAG: acetyl-CoA carboxylase biotin carboxyl carrier protein [Lachnospiraceae bacterium]|nr:acetyl-CoA carboxylase biotin carboxyl carrier protein [Lachnospira sp.]MBQ8729735.1 acetyl-CoA carboxylase biotin carboxyl carrier protein [Lachnospiraceae bacterium]